MRLELDQTTIVALVWVADDTTVYEPTLRSLRASHRDLEIVIGHNGPRPFLDAGYGAEFEHGYSLRTLIERVSHGWTRHVLLVTGAVIVPEGLLDCALRAVEDDMRLATVSFLSNAAGYLSIPSRNTPGSHQFGPHDEVSLTHLLRTIEPAGEIIPIPVPAGDVTLLSRFALGAVDGYVDLPSTSAFLTADFAMRACERGFVSAVDSATYVSRATDIARYAPEPIDNDGSDEQHAFVYRHPYVREVYLHERNAQDSPLGLAISVASAKARGLRIIIDGADVGPKEMGTQTHVLSLVQSLARRSDVDRVDLALPGEVPDYAYPYLTSGKVRPFVSHAMTRSSSPGSTRLPGRPRNSAFGSRILYAPSTNSAAFSRWNSSSWFVSTMQYGTTIRLPLAIAPARLCRVRTSLPAST